MVIVMIEKVYYCDNIRIVFFFGDEFVWFILLGNFLLESVFKDNENYIFYIGYNIFLIEVIKSGIVCLMEELYEGLFVLVLLVVKGNNIFILVIILIFKENLFFLEIFIRFMFYLIYFDFVNFNMF